MCSPSMVALDLIWAGQPLDLSGTAVTLLHRVDIILRSCHLTTGEGLMRPQKNEEESERGFGGDEGVWILARLIVADFVALRKARTTVGMPNHA